MKCPKCVELALKSILYTSGGCITTGMCPESYYDEDGKRHWHDPNGSTSTYECSNGHQVSVTTHDPCGSCDYNKDCYQVIVVREKAG